MKTLYDIQQQALVESTSPAAAIRIFIEPTDAEKQELLESLHIDRHTLESALDPEEISRMELTGDLISIIWKRPNNVSFEQQLRFEVSSVGLFLRPDALTIVLGEGIFPVGSKELGRVTSLIDVVLKFFLHTIHHFLGHVRVIKQINNDLQNKLNVSMENEYFLQMFTLSENLIYYLNALEANSGVLAKFRASGEKTGLTKENFDLLDDINIEHQQCCRQTQIYTTVLSGLLDARGNIINNNMNVLLRNLTLINVVFLPLNLIAGIGGMSEFSMITVGVDWRVSYGLFTVGTLLFGWLTWLYLVKKINRIQTKKVKWRVRRGG